MPREIREGMNVRSSDGEKLGKVISCGADEFIVEKGFFFPKGYVVRYEQARVDGDEVLLSMPASSLREAGDESGAARERTASGLGTQMGTYATDTSGRIVEGGDRGALSRGAGEDVRVPVAEEEVEIRERPVVKEEVRISRTPRTVEQRAEGEVRREEVKIDREGDLTERGEGAVKEPEE